MSGNSSFSKLDEASSSLPGVSRMSSENREAAAGVTARILNFRYHKRSFSRITGGLDLAVLYIPFRDVTPNKKIHCTLRKQRTVLEAQGHPGLSLPQEEAPRPPLP
jgi:hypothetical protein